MDNEKSVITEFASVENECYNKPVFRLGSSNEWTTVRIDKTIAEYIQSKGKTANDGLKAIIENQENFTLNVLKAVTAEFILLRRSVEDLIKFVESRSG